MRFRCTSALEQLLLLPARVRCLPLQGAKGTDLPADLASFTPQINGAAIEVCSTPPAASPRLQYTSQPGTSGPHVQLCCLCAASHTRGCYPVLLLPLMPVLPAPPAPSQVRICAEDPAHNYRPCTGMLGLVAWPTSVATRIDTWVETGVEVSGAARRCQQPQARPALLPLAPVPACPSLRMALTPGFANAALAWGGPCLTASSVLPASTALPPPAAYYDSLLAKLMVHSPEGRPAAITKICAALEETQVGGAGSCRGQGC